MELQQKIEKQKEELENRKKELDHIRRQKAEKILMQ